ncbi:hypothetical protein NC652_005094 [Populus alba x Populus x berolinensis]|nr:hypothetical protein NC652_005094 [Populus alba x Populus x berolinensis]
MNNVTNQGVNLCCPQMQYLEKFQDCWFFGYGENHRFVKFPISKGMDPLIALRERIKDLNLANLPNVRGIGPVSVLELTSKLSRFLMFPISLGRALSRLL